MTTDMKPASFGSLSHADQEAALQHYMIKAGPSFQRSCGDGRKALNGNVFVKNFGGSLGAATVLFVSKWRNGQPTAYGDVVNEAINALAGTYDLGGHRDQHNDNNPTTSGCGYADNRTAIVSRVANTENFDQVINSVFSDAINDGNRALWESILKTYQAIDAKQKEDTALTPNGEQLIGSLEAKDSTILMLEGAHEEYAIVFNHAKGYTLDTNKLVDDGGSAFCVDIWDAMAQTSHLGVIEEEAKLIYYAEWVATALVLVVDKGNPLPPIFFVPDSFAN